MSFDITQEIKDTYNKIEQSEKELKRLNLYLETNKKLLVSHLENITNTQCKDCKYKYLQNCGHPIVFEKYHNLPTSLITVLFDFFKPKGICSLYKQEG